MNVSSPGISFLEPSDKMSDGIVLTVSHNRSLFSQFVFYIKRFSLWFNKNLAWTSRRYNYSSCLLYPCVIKMLQSVSGCGKKATNLTRNRSRHVEVSCKNGILKNLKNFSESLLCWIAKFLRAPILQNTFRTTASL